MGFAPVAPGTFGSAAGVLLFAATQRFGLLAHLVLVVAVTLLGVWAAGASEATLGRSDDGRIVIDELAGQLLALTPVLGAGGAQLFAGAVTAFVAFRVFDIAKPGPVRWAERRFRGGVGVMADDLVAGLLAAAVVASVALLVAAIGGGAG